MALPDNWDNSTTNNVARPGADYINWQWDGTAYGYDAAKALFDFRVIPFTTGEQSAELDEENTWAVSFNYKVIDISGEGRGFNIVTDAEEGTVQPSQQRLIREILMLSYATSNPLPKKGDTLFPSEDSYPDETPSDWAVSGWTTPKVDTISIKQENGNADVWIVSYRAKKIKYGNAILRPDPTENPPELRDPYPWEKKPKVTVTFGTEEYVLGMGYDLGELQPSQISAAFANPNGLGSLLTPAGTESYEVMVNSVGDPFKNPPTTKIGVTNFNVETAFTTDDPDAATVISAMESAILKINDSDITLDVGGLDYNIYQGNGMVTAASVNPAEYIDTREWLPNQKHPFGKTYEDLGWTYSGDDTEVAVNRFSKTLSVRRTLAYNVVTFTITHKQMGWGVAIPNKGFRSFDEGDGIIPEPIREKGSTISEERLLYGEDDGANKGKVIPAGTSTTDLHCLRAYCTFDADTSLDTLLTALPWDREFPEPIPEPEPEP